MMEAMRETEEADAIVIEAEDDFGGGDTKAHYTPVAPRPPAYPIDPDIDALLEAHGIPADPLREINAARGFPAATPPTACQPSIAEMFQEQLRRAYVAGVQHGSDADDLRDAANEAAFQQWYAREVLR